MKRLTIFLCCALPITQPALANGPWIGPGQQPIVFSTGQLGDGSDAHGGVPPAYETGSAPVELADIADNFVEDYTSTNVTYKSVAEGAMEAKFRTICNISHIGQFDPVVFPGQNNVGHLHMFYGNTQTSYDSTYTSLRTTGESTCGGNKLNRTAYWAPAFEEELPWAPGLTAVRKPDNIVIYYTFNPLSLSAQGVRFARGFRYVAGYDPADPANAKLSAAVAAANAAGGSYSMIGSGNGFLGWSCLVGSTPYNGSNANSPVPGSSVQPYLRNPDGTATLTCPTDSSIYAEVDAPSCWDGRNIASPDGRSHVSYTVRNNATGQPVCPDNWYKFPDLIQKFIFQLHGDEPVNKFFLSSDVMDYGAPDPSSPSPCRQVSNHYCYGETMHFDWFGAWSYGTIASPSVMLDWMNHCTGVEITGLTGGTMAADPHECDSSTFKSDKSLQIGGTTSTGLAFGDAANHYPIAKDRYFPITPGMQGDVHVDHRH